MLRPATPTPRLQDFALWPAVPEEPPTVVFRDGVFLLQDPDPLPARPSRPLVAWQPPGARRRLPLICRLAIQGDALASALWSLRRSPPGRLLLAALASLAMIGVLRLAAWIWLALS